MCLKLTFLGLLVHVLEELYKDILWQRWVGDTFCDKDIFQDHSSQPSNPAITTWHIYISL